MVLRFASSPRGVTSLLLQEAKAAVLQAQAALEQSRADNEAVRERGETVRKLRVIQSDALRKKDGRVYNISSERWRGGDVAVRLFHVKKNGKLFLTCCDWLLSERPAKDKILAVIEFERSVKDVSTKWGGLEGNHFAVRTQWRLGDII